VTPPRPEPGAKKPVRRSKRLDPYETLLHVCLTKDEVLVWCKRFNWDEEAPDSAGVTYDATDTKTHEYHVVVYIDVNQPDTYVINTITHEAVHVGGMILTHVGQKHNGMSEAFAYLVGYVAEYIHAEWNKTKEKNNGEA